MFFTIIIPTYNNLSLLKLALSSCQRQRFSDFEVIITDDSTNEVIEEYVSHLHLPWLKYHRNQSSLGAINNWNHGLTLAKGDHIMVLHHDESMASDDFLTCVSAAFLPQVDVVVSNVSVDGRRQKWWLHHVLSPLLLHFPTTLFACNFIGPTACLCYLRTNYIRSHHGHKGQISQTIDIQKVRQSDNETLRKMYASHLRIRLFIFIGKAIRKFLLALHRKRTH